MLAKGVLMTTSPKRTFTSTPPTILTIRNISMTGNVVTIGAVTVTDELFPRLAQRQAGYHNIMATHGP